MKLMFASDIHGSLFYCRQLLEAFEAEKADKLILLGDLLYHGPRNPLPEEYAPAQVAEMLNQKKEYILAVQGNCDSAVDQMVLEFSISATNLLLFLDQKTVFVTHGHIFSPETPPQLQNGDILINGHFHIGEITPKEHYIYMNPGSVSLPKNKFRGYLLYESGSFLLKTLQGEIYTEYKINE